MSTRIGIETIKHASKELAKLAGGLYGAVGDLRLTIGDMQYIKPVSNAIMSLWSIPYAQLRQEIFDLDSEEKFEVAKCFQEEFKIDSALPVEKIIEMGFETLIELLSFLFKILKIGEKIHTSGVVKRAGADVGTLALTSPVPQPNQQAASVAKVEPQQQLKPVTHHIDPVVARV